MMISALHCWGKEEEEGVEFDIERGGVELCIVRRKGVAMCFADFAGQNKSSSNVIYT